MVIDVRSEAEFANGHVKDACNYPILNNEERTLVGACYKQKGNFAAVLLGYKLTGHKFEQYLIDLTNLCPTKIVYIYCYRGGLRSSIMSNLLSSAGFQVYRLVGGYKTYRNWAIQVLKTPKLVYILGGYTGSGKTDRLIEMKKNGAQVIDLEGIANHRGSAFGHIGLGGQSSVEYFENELALQWSKLNPLIPVWIEDESRMIGKANIPDAVFNLMRAAPVFKVNISRADRLTNILNLYGIQQKEALSEATAKLKNRLGGLRLQQALNFLEENNLKAWAELLLQYYDDGYMHGNNKRNSLLVLDISPELFEDYLKNYFPKRLNKVYILLGANLGNILQSFNRATLEIEKSVGDIYLTSSNYITAAWGNTEQDDFINQVIEVHTLLTPFETMEQLLLIEKNMGRIRTEKNAPRIIDLDILFYNADVIQSEFLVVPHPRMAQRRFVLTILDELIPKAIHPVLNQSISSLLRACEDSLEVRKVEN